MEKKEFLISKEFEGVRLDIFLTENLEGKSRSYVQGIIGKEEVKVNGKVKKSNYKLRARDIVHINIPETVPLNVIPEDIPLDILYEDKDIIVVNKPQGMVVHPAPGNLNGTLVNALLNHCKDLSGINGVTRPGIVHRIDKDTSGVLVVAKNDLAHNKLAEQLKDHSMTRVYVALLEGILKKDSGTVDAQLGRHPVERIKIAVVKQGRRAVTHYKVLNRYPCNTLIECSLETGRTHQIRVHMAYIGHPLVGDPVYGYKKQKFNLEGQMLHAKKLGFIHPSTGKYMEFDTKLPDYFKKILEILEK
ncbi:23S rRNA pseudouridine1911/1915/1917 synthase [Clostridium tetanomorphum]|uniref:Pseudouridine synthase n=1 Tax=Clostridium tetanomorphum TaxID=1553 RepID=A0A923E7L9_CLOTT|nr:RluA family pseudouridine synthase [Clostridium tetanomorphum]KAJ53407.1 ribosomal large subunit pseudouridine synthase D [Clostridium tetanomorphum DSM 665]MBC2396606.1 RluA family pseudouridine synthase [Clostridium tetanomorphum]MBP1863936.1 23S rRNA pseudouridine1911/1915/1917 synthase [Clostridium tetanomorphum]NRS85014.1 23S rRNA pseudouridine1911/1915/1917 synthase [Clostridium tetanomorphum]NRZ98230.1 23S rRNA pseudouridine1911/1915/1917 synthase [Clostridium tetanomorphum]